MTIDALIKTLERLSKHYKELAEDENNHDRENIHGYYGHQEGLEDALILVKAYQLSN